MSERTTAYTTASTLSGTLGDQWYEKAEGATLLAQISKEVNSKFHKVDIFRKTSTKDLSLIVTTDFCPELKVHFPRNFLHTSSFTVECGRRSVDMKLPPVSCSSSAVPTTLTNMLCELVHAFSN